MTTAIESGVAPRRASVSSEAPNEGIESPISPIAKQTLAIAALAVFLVSLDTTILFVALPDIRRTLVGVTPGGLAWILNAYTIGYGALLLPAGGLADRFGSKRLFLGGVAVFVAASLLAGAAPSIALLIAARALQALGGAMLVPASLALILDVFPVRRRGVAIGIWGAMGGLASALGPAVGSWVVHAGGWRWAFLVNLPVGLAALSLGARRLRDGRAERRSGDLDLLGSGLLVGAMGAGSYAVLGAREGASTAPWALAAVASLALLLRRSLGRPSALFDVRLLGAPRVGAASLLSFVFGAAFTAMFFTNVFFLTARWGLSTLAAGLYLSPGPLSVVPVAIIAGRLGDRAGQARPLAVGGALFALGAAALWAMHQSHAPRIGPWLGGSMLLGAGIGLILPSLSAASVGGVPAERYGAAAALHQTVRQLGSVIGVAIAVTLLGGLGDGARFDRVFVWLMASGVLLAGAAPLLRESTT